MKIIDPTDPTRDDLSPTRNLVISQNMGWVELLEKKINNSLPKNIEISVNGNHCHIDLEAIQEKNISLVTGLKKCSKCTLEFEFKEIPFTSEYELMLAQTDFMLENLKKITREEETEIKPIGKFNHDLIKTLLSIEIKDFFQNWNPHNYFNSYIPFLIEYFQAYIEYINYILEALKNKETKGLYKIGICPYHKLKDKKECGKIFMGWQWKQEACTEHLKKWHSIKKNWQLKEKKKK